MALIEAKSRGKVQGDREKGVGMSYIVWTTGQGEDTLFKVDDSGGKVLQEMTREEAFDLYDALAESLGLFRHLNSGCEDDSCPCYARGARR